MKMHRFVLLERESLCRLEHLRQGLRMTTRALSRSLVRTVPVVLKQLVIATMAKSIAGQMVKVLMRSVGRTATPRQSVAETPIRRARNAH
jgi:hypothetical protein